MDPKRSATLCVVNSVSQRVDVLGQKLPATLQEGDGEEIGGARDECSDVAGHSRSMAKILIGGQW